MYGRLAWCKKNPRCVSGLVVGVAFPSAAMKADLDLGSLHGLVQPERDHRLIDPTMQKPRSQVTTPKITTPIIGKAKL